MSEKGKRFHIDQAVRVTFNRQAPYDPPVLIGKVDAIFRDEIVVTTDGSDEHWAFYNEVEPLPDGWPDRTEEIAGGFGDKWLP